MSKQRILVIDDVPDLLKRMRVLLESAGYEVDAATNGEEGLALARKNPPTLACIDLTMPKMSGFDVCEVFREDPALKHVPILVISARTTPDARVHSEDVGADGFLPKPFKQQELFDEIKRIIKEKSK